MSDLSIPAGQYPFMQQLLFVGRNLDFQSTSDQALIRNPFGTNFVVTNVVAVRKTGGATVACTGGIYSAVAKGGSAIVAAGQSWLALTGTLGLTVATVATLSAALSVNQIYLSLTTGSTAAVTGDLFVYGLVVD